MRAGTGPSRLSRSPWACGDQAEGQGPREEQGVGQRAQVPECSELWNVPEAAPAMPGCREARGWSRGRTFVAATGWSLSCLLTGWKCLV